MRKRTTYISIFFIIILLSGCGALPVKKVKYIEVNSRNCYVCQRMEPIIDELVKEFGPIIDVSTYSNTSDSGEDIVKKYNIKKFPANIFIDEKGIMFFKYEGLLDKPAIKSVLKEHGVVIPGAVSITAEPVVIPENVKKVKVTEYYAPGCESCALTEPVIKEIEKFYGSKIEIVRINLSTQDGTDKGKAAGVKAIPLIIFTDKLGNDYFRHEGKIEAQLFKALLNDKI